MNFSDHNVVSRLLANPSRDEFLLYASCLVCRTQGSWTISNFIEQHRHYPDEPPRPLTRRQREQVRLQSTHRRGMNRAALAGRV